MDTADYVLTDPEHNAWACGVCGHMERFEADGPYENGWNHCPACGLPITACGRELYHEE